MRRSPQNVSRGHSEDSVTFSPTTCRRGQQRAAHCTGTARVARAHRQAGKPEVWAQLPRVSGQTEATAPALTASGFAATVRHTVPTPRGTDHTAAFSAVAPAGSLHQGGQEWAVHSGTGTHHAALGPSAVRPCGCGCASQTEDGGGHQNGLQLWLELAEFGKAAKINPGEIINGGRPGHGLTGARQSWLPESSSQLGSHLLSYL